MISIWISFTLNKIRLRDIFEVEKDIIVLRRGAIFFSDTQFSGYLFPFHAKPYMTQSLLALLYFY